MKKIFMCIFCLCVLLLISCNNTTTPLDFALQQEDDADSSGNAEYDIVVELSSIFDVIQPLGVIECSEYTIAQNEYEDNLNNLPILKSSSDSILSLDNFSTSLISNSVISFTFDSGVETSFYNTEQYDQWQLSDDSTYLSSQNSSNSYTYEYSGSDISMPLGELTIPMTDVMYYKYQGYNPFFSVESNYNQATFGSHLERGMERFIFYRYTCSVIAMPQDAMLVAVDTYTSMLFTYAVPSSLSGVGAPEKWVPIDILPNAFDGEKHFFYEYDPIGYVNAEYEFVIYPVVENKNQGDLAKYYPKFTGISPYLTEVYKN